jgi:hypothetical protein
MKHITFLIPLFILIFSSCGAKIEFDSTKSLDDWYAETAAMEGNQVWGSIVYPLPPTEGISVSRLSLEGDPVIDLYYPDNGKKGKKLPVIITPRIFKMDQEFNQWGRSLLSWEYEISWAHLLAGSGFVVLKFETNSPINGLPSIMTFLEENHKALNIDINNIGFFAVSSNPTAVLQFLAQKDIPHENVKAAGFLFPDLSGIPFPFVDHVPYFIASGEYDDPQMNRSVVKFTENLDKNNLEYVYMHHPEGKHGFDALQDDENSYKIIKGLLEFYNKKLSVSLE